LQANEGPAIWYTTTRMTLKATGESTGGTISVVEALAAPDTSPPWHVHRYDDEMFYILEGAFLLKCGDDVFEEVQVPSSSCRVGSRTASRSSARPPPASW
jgi:mannose-6-phosphate isomerase-like protein (cupin superfamily)